ncbi:hypothetical protein KIN20_034944 [Parelaphostrongylus tenuis]|uniref:Fork-head domain-containing protein n=1 Tax=Parelaphostrongylus tenuis TaxID=148309 RepID=A0AAD5RAF8_PARTN|nr:hypothetical protein KIN20_034944 [Parelaphostrongylus tenuis]
MLRTGSVDGQIHSEVLSNESRSMTTSLDRIILSGEDIDVKPSIGKPRAAILRLGSVDGQIHSETSSNESRSMTTSLDGRIILSGEDNDVKPSVGKSRSTYSELVNVLRATKRPESSHNTASVQGTTSSPYHAEYPVKVCTTSFATSILRGNSWTVQASSSLQNHVQLPQNSFHSKIRPNISYNVAHSDTVQPVKTGTQYGITASIARPKQVLSKAVYKWLSSFSLSARSNADNRWLDEDIARYGSIEENYDDFDEWMEKVDVSKFEDISLDLMSRPKSVKKERNPPVASPYPKPGWSYSNLIALALKNSETGQLTVSEIYAFMLEHFPYFRTAPSGWKNSVRHNLSLNKCFCKVELDDELFVVQQTRKSCLWMISPDRIDKVEQDIRKWRERNPDAATEGMARPEDLQSIENGTKGLPLYRTKKLVLKPVSPIKKSPPQEVVPIRHKNPLFNEDAIAAEDLMQLVDEEYHSETDEIVVNHNLLISTIKTEPSDDHLSDYMKPTVTEDSKRTTFPPTEVLVGTSKTSSTKRQRTDSPYSPSKGIPAVDLLPSVFVDAFLNLTPPRAKRLDTEESLSPVQIESGFRHAHDALHDNSLLAAALDQSPYKMPVTFLFYDFHLPSLTLFSSFHVYSHSCSSHFFIEYELSKLNFGFIHRSRSFAALSSIIYLLGIFQFPFFPFLVFPSLPLSMDPVHYEIYEYLNVFIIRILSVIISISSISRQR